MRAYSMDLRERVLLDSDAGMKAADVAAKYRVSGSWVRLLNQRRRETGEVAPRVQRQGRRSMLEPHLHTLADLIAAHPGRTLAELKDAPARLPGPPSGTCHPIARTAIPSSSASRSSRPSFAPHAVAAARRSGRSSAPVSSISALTNAATIFGTAGTRSPHGHEKRASVSLRTSSARDAVDCGTSFGRCRCAWRAPTPVSSGEYPAGLCSCPTSRFLDTSPDFWIPTVARSVQRGP